jgi:hypothetical protein
MPRFAKKRLLPALAASSISWENIRNPSKSASLNGSAEGMPDTTKVGGGVSSTVGDDVVLPPLPQATPRMELQTMVMDRIVFRWICPSF